MLTPTGKNKRKMVQQTCGEMGKGNCCSFASSDSTFIEK